MRRPGILLVLVLALISAGCQSLAFYAQAVTGHAAVVARSRSIEGLLERDVDAAVRQRLEAVVEIREFAATELKLPDNGSYTRYADLSRRHVVWNVFATGRNDLELKQWCYPVIGCAAYRGFFNERRAERYADLLRSRGLDVFVAGVDAYSTLGWFKDPVLNTFMDYPLPEFAGLLIHELSHQRIFVPHDTVFNESMATAVEEYGVRSYLLEAGQAALLKSYSERQQQRRHWQRRFARARTELRALYQQIDDSGLLIRAKTRILDGLYRDYRDRNPSAGAGMLLERSDFNNALIAGLALYQDLTPAFGHLIAETRGDFELFFDRIEQLAALPKALRHETLRRLSGESSQ